MIDEYGAYVVGLKPKLQPQQKIDFTKSINKAIDSGFSLKKIAAKVGVTCMTIRNARDKNGRIRLETAYALTEWLIEKGFAVSKEND